MNEVYETKAMQALESFLKHWNPYSPHCVLLLGPTGVGKTFTVKYLAQKLKMDWVSFGSDNPPLIEQLKSTTKTSGWLSKHVIIHLDRPLWWMSMADLKKIIKETLNPIVIEIDQEEKKYYKSLNCVEIYVDPPPKRWIVQQIKKTKIVEKPLYNKVSSDVRQSLLLAYGSQGYGKKDWLVAIDKYFKHGDTSQLEPSHLPVLLDTGLKLYYGYNLYEFIKRLIVADMTKRLDVLAGMKTDFKYGVPIMRYYEKIKILKESGTG